MNAFSFFAFAAFITAFADISFAVDANFSSELECRRRVSDLKFDSRVASREAYDCLGGSPKAQFKDCSRINYTQQQQILFWELSNKSHDLSRQAAETERICDRLARNPKTANPYAYKFNTENTGKNIKSTQVGGLAPSSVEEKRRKRTRVYVKIENAVDDIQTQVQKYQSPVVNKIQNEAGKRLKVRNNETLQDMETVVQKIKKPANDQGQAF